MNSRHLITAMATMQRIKFNLINRLLGPLGRASRIIADADARLIGMVPAQNMVQFTPTTPFFNQVRVITSQQTNTPTP